MDKKYDVAALSAICVDIQIAAEDATIEKHGLKKGFTNSVSAATLAGLLVASDNSRTTGSPGGNVSAGIALRGGNVALIGKIANDDNGRFFASRAAAHGIDYTPLLSTNKDTVTTCAAVLITPDKERTFAFLSGAGVELSPEDIDAKIIAQSKITYLDSYLWLSEQGKAAVHHAAELARTSGGKVAIALNDAEVVSQNREAFLSLAKSHGNILLGDQREFSRLLGTSTFEETVEAVHKLGCIASITAGAKGAYIVHDGTVTHIPSRGMPEKIVDTNGAGDQFAAGFLYGLAQGKTPAEAGHQGAHWAADVIQHAGAEPRVGKNAPPAPPTGPKSRLA